MRFSRVRAMFLATTLLLWTATVTAQAPMAPPTELPPAAPASLKLSDLWFEVLITGGFCGLAIFAVCRSSPRN